MKSIRHLNQKLGWVKAEIAVMRAPQQQGKHSRKRSLFRTWLLRIYGKNSLTVRKLLCVREKMKGMLRVKLL
jgi:hypothetical protein